MFEQISREVLDIGAAAIRPGITTDEIGEYTSFDFDNVTNLIIPFSDEIIHNATIERGAYPSPLNYYKFPKSVCT